MFAPPKRGSPRAAGRQAAAGGAASLGPGPEAARTPTDFGRQDGGTLAEAFARARRPRPSASGRSPPAARTRSGPCDGSALRGQPRGAQRGDLGGSSLRGGRGFADEVGVAQECADEHFASAPALRDSSRIPLYSATEGLSTCMSSTGGTGTVSVPPPFRPEMSRSASATTTAGTNTRMSLSPSTQTLADAPVLAIPSRRPESAAASIAPSDCDSVASPAGTAIQVPVTFDAAAALHRPALPTLSFAQSTPAAMSGLPIAHTFISPRPLGLGLDGHQAAVSGDGLATSPRSRQTPSWTAGGQHQSIVMRYGFDPNLHVQFQTLATPRGQTLSAAAAAASGDPAAWRAAVGAASAPAPWMAARPTQGAAQASLAPSGPAAAVAAQPEGSPRAPTQPVGAPLAQAVPAPGGKPPVAAQPEGSPSASPRPPLPPQVAQPEGSPRTPLQRPLAALLEGAPRPQLVRPPSWQPPAVAQPEGSPKTPSQQPFPPQVAAPLPLRPLQLGVAQAPAEQARFFPQHLQFPAHLVLAAPTAAPRIFSEAEARALSEDYEEKLARIRSTNQRILGDMERVLRTLNGEQGDQQSGDEQKEEQELSSEDEEEDEELEEDEGNCEVAACGDAMYSCFSGARRHPIRWA